MTGPLAMRQPLTHLQDLIERGHDRQLRLAVTGLSRSGKTAFLTSLVNQLRHAGLEARLDLLPAAREGRLLGFAFPRFRPQPLEGGALPSHPPGCGPRLADRRQTAVSESRDPRPARHFAPAPEPAPPAARRMPPPRRCVVPWGWTTITPTGRASWRPASPTTTEPTCSGC